MKGGNTYDEAIDPEIVDAVKEYVRGHTLTGRELVMDMPREILPLIPPHVKRQAVCMMRLQGIIKYNGFVCTVRQD